MIPLFCSCVLVASLQTLCRKIIQKHIVHRMALDWLELPELLKHYCKYEWAYLDIWAANTFKTKIGWNVFFSSPTFSTKKNNNTNVLQGL